MESNNTIRVHFSQWLALFPLLVFVIGAMYLGLSGSPDERGFWPIMVLTLIISMLISKEKKQFYKVIIEGMSNNLLMIMVCAWIFSSIIGTLLSETGLITTIVAIYSKTGLEGGYFVVGVFLISALIGTSTGTAVGTVLIVTPVLYGAGLNIGCSPYFLLGAILGGGAFGDDFSPLSDTSIAVANTQNIELGLSVRSRLKYAVVAALIASIVFIVFGSNHEQHIVSVENINTNYLTLLMLSSPLIIIILCFKGYNILNALFYGILVGIVIGLVTGLLSLSDIFSLDKENFSAKSLIITGMDKGIGISIFSILLVGQVSFILATGLIDKLVKFVVKKSNNIKLGELIIIFTTIFVNILLAHNTITIMSIGDFVKRISDKYKINSYRAANLMDIAGNTVMHIFPYMITVILASSIANQIPDAPQINPFKAGLHNFHSIALFIISLIVSISGIWRKADQKFSDLSNNV